jgi:hydrogenase expression/formation protein HypD
MAVLQAQILGLTNFSLLSAQVLVPPAIEMILGSPDCRVQGFLAPGHVCTVAGYADYERLAEKYKVPLVVTGFEPLDILHGIQMTLELLEAGRPEVKNQYSRVAKREGNVTARQAIEKVFEVVDRSWRGLGIIPRSGLGLKPAFAHFDADKRFEFVGPTGVESTVCISGLVLQGRKKPHECPAFGTACKPEHPLGAPMVSSEGACAAYYRYRREEPSRMARPDKGTS